MSFNLKDMNDPRNLIKKCPHCGLYWYKVEGCDGQTNCGSIPSKKYDFFEKAKSFFKYSFKWMKGKLILEKNNETKRIDDLNKRQQEKIPEKKLIISNKKLNCNTNNTNIIIENIFGIKLKNLFSVKKIPQKKAPLKRRGCGKAINWKDLPCLDEETLLDFFKVKSIEEVKILIGNKTYSNCINDVKRETNFNFHRKGCSCNICQKYKN